jgi:hypothetical protein
MIQSLLLFLAPALKAPVAPSAESPPRRPMAARHTFEPIGHWWNIASEGLAVLTNALGFLLFLVGLGLVLRLAEVLMS